jgi:Fur family peroxide stress response transcriptional regulator
MTRKYSRQREEILYYLSTRKDHPTADNIYAAVRGKLPNISLGTVYRNLTLLADRGEILRLHFADGVDRFDYDTTPHSHFICKNCGRVTDIPIYSSDTIMDAVRNQFDGQIEGQITYFYGTCSDCLKKNKTQEKGE